MRDRPQEIARPRVYGNFRPTLKQRHAALQQPSVWKKERIDELFREMIRRSECAVCPARGNVDPAHLRSGPAKRTRGLGLKAPDQGYLLPLCRFHHEDLDTRGSRNEAAWFTAHGFDDVYEFARALHRAKQSGGERAFLAVLRANKEAAFKVRQGEVRDLSKKLQMQLLRRQGLTKAEALEQVEWCR